MAGSLLPDSVSVRDASSASQKATKRTPTSEAADSEIARSSSSRSSALDSRWLTAASARMRSACTRSVW